MAKQIADDRETLESTADFLKTEADKAARYAAAINDKLEAAGLPRRASLLVSDFVTLKAFLGSARLEGFKGLRHRSGGMLGTA